MPFNFDKDKAEKADRPGFINEGGHYVGVLDSAVRVQKESGAEFVNFKFESTDGARADYLGICVTQRNGEEAFGVGHVYALMGLLGLQTLREIAEPDGIGYPDLLHKPIAISLQKEWRVKQDGSIGFQMNVLHFHDAATKQTYSEKAANKPAQFWSHQIKDKELPAMKAATPTSAAAPQSDPLPF